jgi:hypothetical protein
MDDSIVLGFKAPRFWSLLPGDLIVESTASAVSQLMIGEFPVRLDQTKVTSSGVVWELLPRTTQGNVDRLCCPRRSACQTCTYGPGKCVPSWLQAVGPFPLM